MTLNTLDRLVNKVASSLSRQVSATVESDITKIRSDLAEIVRMIGQQGDAADEVAETLGRTIAKLSAEVDELADAVADLKGHDGEVRSPA